MKTLSARGKARGKRYLGVREYADRRGVSIQAVQKALRAGRIRKTSTGKIDAASADRDWEANSAATPRTGRAVSMSANPEQPDPGMPEKRSLAEARRQKEWALAEKHQIEVDVRKGELIERKQVLREQFDTYRAVRDRLLGIPDRLADELAVESDPADIHALLTAEVRHALGELADGLEAMEAAA